MCNDLGEKIRLARIQKGLTQYELAEMLQVSPALICKIEASRSGKKTQKNKIFLRKISAILGLEYKQLLIDVGHIIDKDDNEYYTTTGEPIDMDIISKKIYYTDADILVNLSKVVTDVDNCIIIKKVLSLLVTINKEKRKLLHELLQLF